MKDKSVSLYLIAALILLGATGLFAFTAFQGKYMFRAEPQREREAVPLAQKPLQSREPLETLFMRERLETDAQRDAYDTVSDYALAVDSDRFSLYGVSEDDLQIVLNAFRSDHPEVFWVDSFSCVRYGDSDPLYAELNYTDGYDELLAQRDALRAAVEAAAAGAPDQASDYEVELYLNDYIADRCVYELEGEGNHTAYGALVGGHAVCDGYSRAFQLLCRRLGIECTVVEGSSDFDGGEGDGHMWNCIQLGGDWYHVDVTWNDAAEPTCEAERYFYLNLTTEQISRDHRISGGFDGWSQDEDAYFNIYVPACNSDALNYMRLNFVTVGNPEHDEPMVAALIEAARQKRSYCAFLLDDGADIQALSQSITERYAAEWIRGANHFLNGKPAIAGHGRNVTYENRRVMAILLEYD